MAGAQTTEDRPRPRRPGDDVMSQESALVASLLRPDRPEVAALRDLAREGRWDAFDRDLLAYMRGRPGPLPVFDPAAVPDLMRRIAAVDREAFDRTAAIARHARDRQFPNSTNPTIQHFVPVDDGYDFASNPTSDPQFVYAMNRLRWMPELARMFRASGDRSYLDSCLSFWRLYVERTGYPVREDFERGAPIWYGHLPPPWARLDACIRLTNLWWTYWLLLTADELAPADHTWMVAHLARLHDTVLSYGPQDLRGNHAAMQFESLYLTAAMWPELHGMEASALCARMALEESVRHAYYVDGLQFEQSPHYGVACLQIYGQPFLLARRNGHAWSKGYGDLLRIAFAAYDRLATPGGTCPALGDSDPDPVAPFLSLGRALFPDLAFTRDVPPTAAGVWYGVPAGPAPAVAEPPRVHLYAHAGLALVKHGGNYLTFDCGPHGGWHGHQDLLHVHYWLRGRMLLADGGRWLYADNDPLRRWAMSPAAHNTVAVDGRPMAQLEYPDHPALERIRLAERDELVFMVAGHHAFDAPGRPALCRRHVALDPAAGWLLVVDDLSADESLAWRQHWLFGREDVRLDHDRVAVPGTASLHLAGGEAAIYPQAWSPTYAVQAPGRSVQVTATGPRIVLAMLLIPDGMTGTLQLEAGQWAATTTVDGVRRTLTESDWPARQGAGSAPG